MDIFWNSTIYMYIIELQSNQVTNFFKGVINTLHTNDTRWFYSSKGDPFGLKGLKNYLPSTP